MKSEIGFVRLPHTLVDSAGFADASNGARCLLVLLIRRHNGRNNGDIACSVREAAAWLHCTPRTAMKCFAELQRLGLIEMTRRGSFILQNGVRKDAASRWRLTFADFPNRKKGTAHA